ncbi:MAG: sugar ABC transporter ATP-binding protein [Lachnospiraceae bacterium]|nr:sugar ABC transporter ATP-binding protein [Lachnospiraceae bacterium]
MAEYLLEMKHVVKKFPGVIALKNVDLQLKKGEILGICGENGAGKSTLMKILSGSYPHNSYEGEICIEGKSVKFSDVNDAEKYGIEMIAQEINMVLSSNVAENLYLGKLPGKGNWVDFKTLYSETQRILDYVHVNAKPTDLTSHLNSGQMQMIALMRAYIKNPQILVLDEPTSALTDNEVQQLMEILRELRKKGVSCIYISHKLEEIYEICDRVTVLRDGETISCRDIKDVTENVLIEEMVGRKVENLYPKIEVEQGDEVLRVEHLTIPHPTLKDKNIVEDISFHLNKGEILGIGGLVGAGRSEILGAIFGQLSKGIKKQVFIEGKEVMIHNPEDAISAGIGFVTEERKCNGFVWMLSIKDNMFLASLKNIPTKYKFFIDRKEERKKAQAIFDRLRIKAPSMDVKVNNLSGGNQQKVVLSKWLLKDPKILFVDEPTKGIDVGAKAEIYKLMGELVEKGIAIIMVSSDMPELVSISDRVLTVSSGRITGEFRKEEIVKESIMAAAIK